MGQAKQRGSREERIKEAQARDAEFRKQYEEEMHARVAAIKQKERERLEAMTPEEREAVQLKASQIKKPLNRLGFDAAMILALAAVVRGKKR